MQDKKAERRKKKLAEWERRRLELQLKHQRGTEFPEFEFDEAEGDPEFIALVKEAIQRFDFKELPEIDQSIFRLMKQEGATHALRTLCQAMAKVRKGHPGNQYAQVGDIVWALSLGETVFKKIPVIDRERFLPMNDVRFQPYGKRIVIQFSSLLKHRSSWGTTYYSRHKPTVEFEGKKYVVGFSKEAILRTCERIIPSWRTYAGLGDVYGYFELCLHFEPCVLRDGHPAFTFFEVCEERFWGYRYVNNVLGVENLDPAQGKPYYRVGYCPLVFEGEFAKAKTLLFPGFAKTPEYGALERSNLPLEEKNRLKQVATNAQTVSYLLETDDFSAVSWFHENGVPQVIQRAEPLFGMYKLGRVDGY